MAEHIIKVPRQSDRAIVSFFRTLAKDNNISQVKIRLGAVGTIITPSEGEETELVATLLSANSSLVESISLAIEGLGVTFHRGGSLPPAQKSAVFDEMVLSHDAGGSISELRRLEILVKVSKILGSIDAGRVVSGILTTDQEQLLAMHSSTLQRLETLNEDLIRGSEEFRRNLEKDFQNRSDTLEVDFRERASTLEAETDKRRSSLQEKEEQLNVRIKTIDDRQNTHVRREIRNDILKEIRVRTEKFELTPETIKKRTPIHIVSFLLFTILVIANFYYAFVLSETLRSNPETLPIIILSIKQLVASGAFGAFAYFYLRWMNSWSHEHATAEFKLKQFQLDIERASWVVETALEWKDAKNGTIPNELLEPITRNLFMDNGKGGDESNPADELASVLLGSAAKVNVRSGNSEIEFDGKGIRKIQNP